MEEQGQRNWQKAYTTVSMATFEKQADIGSGRSRRRRRMEENGSCGWDVFCGVSHIFVLCKQSINKIKALSKIYSEVNSSDHDRNLSFAEWISLLAKHG